MSFIDREFRDALSLFPTGVAVVTARALGGYNVGVTVNSFTSVSLKPALISFNLAKSLRSVGDLRNAKSFAVNLLHDKQSHISTSFARAQSDKWSCTECIEGQTATPVLLGNLATFECEPYANYEAGDHIIVVGRVLHIDMNADATPLLFYRSTYRVIGDLAQSTHSPHPSERYPQYREKSS